MGIDGILVHDLEVEVVRSHPNPRDETRNPHRCHRGAIESVVFPQRLDQRLAYRRWVSACSMELPVELLQAVFDGSVARDDFHRVCPYHQRYATVSGRM